MNILRVCIFCGVGVVLIFSLSSCAQMRTDPEKEGWQGPGVSKNEVDYAGEHPADTRVDAFRFKKTL
ncbi:MAG: hypothetical protein AAF984_00140 [Verrucomicrobiota bacterium]